MEIWGGCRCNRELIIGFGKRDSLEWVEMEALQVSQEKTKNSVIEMVEKGVCVWETIWIQRSAHIVGITTKLLITSGISIASPLGLPIRHSPRTSPLQHQSPLYCLRHKVDLHFQRQVCSIGCSSKACGIFLHNHPSSLRYCIPLSFLIYFQSLDPWFGCH